MYIYMYGCNFTVYIIYIYILVIILMHVSWGWGYQRVWFQKQKPSKTKLLNFSIFYIHMAGLSKKGKYVCPSLFPQTHVLNLLEQIRCCRTFWRRYQSLQDFVAKGLTHLFLNLKSLLCKGIPTLIAVDSPPFIRKSTWKPGIPKAPPIRWDRTSFEPQGFWKLLPNHASKSFPYLGLEGPNMAKRFSIFCIGLLFWVIDTPMPLSIFISIWTITEKIGQDYEKQKPAISLFADGLLLTLPWLLFAPPSECPTPERSPHSAVEKWSPMWPSPHSWC